jgi:hypothetical protein
VEFFQLASYTEGKSYVLHNIYFIHNKRYYLGDMFRPRRVILKPLQIYLYNLKKKSQKCNVKMSQILSQ